MYSHFDYYTSAINFLIRVAVFFFPLAFIYFGVVCERCCWWFDVYAYALYIHGWYVISILCLFLSSYGSVAWLFVYKTQRKKRKKKLEEKKMKKNKSLWNFAQTHTHTHHKRYRHTWNKIDGKKHQTKQSEKKTQNWSMHNECTKCIFAWNI